jgi:hypothetical protein
VSRLLSRRPFFPPRRAQRTSAYQWLSVRLASCLSSRIPFSLHLFSPCVRVLVCIASICFATSGGLHSASFLTARRMLRASEVRPCHEDCIFASSQARFLSLTAKANQLALSSRKDICIALTVPVLTVSAGLAKHFSPPAEHGSNAITTLVSCCALCGDMERHFDWFVYDPWHGMAGWCQIYAGALAVGASRLF